MIIGDGTGTGNRARVRDNRLHVSGPVLNANEYAGRQGESFNINSGNITLTTANESAVLYLKNNEQDNLIINTIGFFLGNSTGGSGDVNLAVLRNPTTGTIITNAVIVDVNSNRNYGSARELDIIAYKGVDGDTFTNGISSFLTRLKGTGVHLINTGDVILPKGTSVGLKIQPQTGNTLMVVEVILSVHLQNDI